VQTGGYLPMILRCGLPDHFAIARAGASPEWKDHPSSTFQVLKPRLWELKFPLVQGNGAVLKTGQPPWTEVITPATKYIKA
jgi:hypothetical protein